MLCSRLSRVLSPAAPAVLHVAPAALLLAALAGPADAGDGLGHRAELFFGPVIGGQPLRLDLRTTAPSAPLLLLYGLDGTPTVPGTPGLPAIGLDVASSFHFFGLTGPDGRFAAQIPTSAGQFGPAGAGFAIFFQALVVAPDGSRLGSNVKATELEPVPVAPGFLVDAAASHLPAGYDNLDGATVEHADLNRDGYPDLVIARADGVAIWRNDGAGGFTDVTAASISMAGDAVSVIVTGDVDGDGSPDLITGGGYDDLQSVPDRLWLNDGAGAFTASTLLPAGKGLTHGLELADLDSDGDLDLVIACGQEAHLSVPGGLDRMLFNLGGGTFFESQNFDDLPWNAPDASTQRIRPGDVDGDGDLDLFVVRGSPAASNVLLLNDGHGEFEDVSATHLLPLHADNSQDATFADIDGDGDLDLLVANSVIGTPASDSGDVLVNQGGAQGGIEGVFVDDPASFLEASTPADAVRLGIVAADIEADGDLDVLVSVHDLFLGADQALYLNQGGAQGGTTGAMARQAWYDPGDFISYGVALFDMDHDGDLDVLQTANGVITGDPAQQFQTRLFENTQL
jgi:hypothetical protein